MSVVGNFDDSSSDRLEGTRSMVGGLILKGNNKKTSQAPKESVLGLQKLAEEKRKRKLEEDGEKPKRLKDLSKNRETCTGDWEDPNDDDLDGRARLSSGIRNKDFKSKSRHYRAGLVETPSHTGGVNEEIREKQLRRLERDRGTRRGGVYAESKIKDRDDKDSRKNRDKNDSFSDREKKRYDEGERSSRRSQDYRDDGDNYFKEPRSKRGEWEETPYRSSRSSRNEGYNTPRHKSKGTQHLLFCNENILSFTCMCPSIRNFNIPWMDWLVQTLASWSKKLLKCLLVYGQLFALPDRDK